MRLETWLKTVAPTRNWSALELIRALCCVWTTRPTRVSMDVGKGESVAVDVKSYEPGNTPDDL